MKTADKSSHQGPTTSFTLQGRWRRRIGIVTAVGAWWLLVVMITQYSVALLHRPDMPDYVKSLPGSAALKANFSWDAGWYYGITVHGYPAAKSGTPAFYPLFPLAVRAVSHLGLNPLAAADVVNFISTIVAASFLYLLALDFTGDREVAKKTLPLFLFFPTAFFLTAYYTEAMFCALLFGAFYFARHRRWALACSLLALLTAVRLPGMVAVLGVFIEYLASKHFSFRSLDRNICWFLLAPAGFISYAAFLYIRYHDPLMMIHAYSFGDWTYQKLNLNIAATIASQLQAALYQLGHHAYISALNHVLFPFGFWVAAIALTVFFWRQLPISYSFFMLASLLIFALNSNFESVDRYVLPLFPIFLVLGSKLAKPGRELTYAFWLAGSAMALAIWTLQFVNWYWVA